MSLAYAHLIDYIRPWLDPDLRYLGLEIMLSALIPAVLGGLLFLRGLFRLYSRPLIVFGYGLSVIAVAIGLFNPTILVYPAVLATLLYLLTAYLTPKYQEGFWRATVIAANISFGAVVHKINPNYNWVTYAKYFIVFNLFKLSLGCYFQYVKKNIDFAFSNYAGLGLTSLASLIITLIWGNYDSISLVWLSYGLIYLILVYLLKLPMVTYLATAVVTVGIAFLCKGQGIEPDQLGLFLSALSFVWLGLSVLFKDFPMYAKPMALVIPISIGLAYIYNLGSGLDAIIAGSVMAAAAMLIQGKLQKARIYYFLAPLVLSSGYEAFLVKNKVGFEELYLAPVSLYLIIISFFLRTYNKRLNYLSYAGLLLFMGVSYLNSFSGEDFLLHALVLGVVSFVSVLLGVAFKHRGFFFLGIIFLLGDVTTQTRSFFGSLQKWFWIGLGGSMFLALGLLFDKKRKNRTLGVLNRQVEKFKSWS